MPKSDKIKTAGKFAVIMLCFAILFFLLLPFLEDPASAVSPDKAKKATPQIFTSNPLSELVRKVYSVFAKNQKMYRAADNLAYADGCPTPVQSAQEARYAADAAPQGQEQANGSSVSYAPQDYDYGEAGFINEDGEWILVRQTVPDASRRGLHEVSSSDSPYSRLLRLERAAKYAPAAVQAPAIPDSKWARLFRPIKNFFGLDHSDSSAKQDHSQEEIFALASADGGLNRGGTRRPGASEYKQGADWAMPSVGAEAGASAGSNQIVFDLLNPFSGLEQTVDGLKDTASRTLDKEQQPKFEKYLNGRRHRAMRALRRQIREDLAKDAEGQEVKELAGLTLQCKGGSSGFYNQNSDTVCYSAESIPTGEERSGLDKEALEAQNSSRQVIDEKISELAGINYHSEKPVNMLIVLGKTKPGEVISSMEEADENKNETTPENKENKKIFQEFINYMYTQQNCESQNCYWVGSEFQPIPSLRHTVQSAGFEYLGDPLSKHKAFFEQFVLQKTKSGEEVPEDLGTYIPYYVPYTKEDMDKVNKRNAPDFSSGKMKKPEDPFLVYVPSAANTLDMEEVLTHPYFVLYDDKDSWILDQGNPNAVTPQERGEQIRNLYIKRLEYGAELNKQNSQKVQQDSAAELLRLSATKVQKELREAPPKDIDAAMKLK